MGLHFPKQVQTNAKIIIKSANSILQNKIAKRFNKCYGTNKF